MKKYLFILFLITSFLTITFASTHELPQTILDALRMGNSTELAKHFDNNVELVILEQEEVYSRAQAEIILQNFFGHYKPKGFDLLHEGGKEDKQYAIGNLVTQSGVFRVTFFMVTKPSGEELIQQLRIEEML